MAEDSDGVAETFDESLRVALTVASQFGERVSRLCEQLAREREADARTEARQLQGRFDAERSATRAQLAAVTRPEWWDHAGVADIAAAQQTATAWRAHDDVAARAATTIHTELRDRYGIDTDRLDADPAAVRRQLEAAERDRAAAAEQRRQAQHDLVATEILLARAEARDATSYAAEVNAWQTVDTRQTEQTSRGVSGGAGPVGSDAQLAYDSAERRAAFARKLEGTATEQEIRGRLLADLGNARHPREAVARRGSRAAQLNRARANSGVQREFGGLSR